MSPGKREPRSADAHDLVMVSMPLKQFGAERQEVVRGKAIILKDDAVRFMLEKPLQCS